MTERETPVSLENTASVPAVTFGSLGLADERGTLLGLPRSDLLCFKQRHGDGAMRYFALLDKPLRSGMLTELLNSVAPLSLGGKTGIEADFRMPQEVLAGTNSTYSIQLHSDHANDPLIGPAYQEFVRYHNDRWLEALHTHGPFADIVDTIRFIRSETLAQQTFAQRIKALADFSEGINPDQKIAELARYRRILIPQSGGGPFSAYISARLEPREVVPEGWSSTVEFSWLSTERKISLLRAYLEQLDPSDQHAFALGYFLDKHHILIDPEKGNVWFTQDHVWVNGIDIDIIDTTTLRIREKRGDNEQEAIVTLAGSRAITGETDWHIADIHSAVVPDPLLVIPTPLYGVLAWERSPQGSRRFLSQNEWVSAVPGEYIGDKQADVALGRALTAYFSPSITRRWPTTMSLRDRHTAAKQRMMGAQVATWVSLEQHASDLLSDDNPLIGLIERYIDSAPQ